MNITAGDGETLTSFVYTESVNFIRRTVGVALLVTVIALPAAVFILGLLPEAFGYLIVSLFSLIVILVGAFTKGGEEQEEDEELKFDSRREALLLTAIFYTILATPFSTLLVVSAGFGYLIMGLGYPTIGWMFAAILPFIDRWSAGIYRYASIVNLVGLAISYVIVTVSFIYSIPNRLPNPGWDHRRKIH